MKHWFKKMLLIAISSPFLGACSEMSTKVEQQLNELKTKTESLDSLVNQEIEKVIQLDSVLMEETEKVKKMDSIIQKSASAVDSLAKVKAKVLGQ